MKTNEAPFTAVIVPNQFVEANGRRLAYRSIGTGKPIVLCARFRGNMDVWDPAFLDALAMTGDVKDLLQALELDGAVISGWSLGGMVAQVQSASSRGAGLHPSRQA
jgi:pimeloyl-ACP methyl ester carboxylesterase